jgi:hypothetical protein
LSSGQFIHVHCIFEDENNVSVLVSNWVQP